MPSPGSVLKLQSGGFLSPPEVSVTPLTRDLCAAVADLLRPPTAFERALALLRLGLLMAVLTGCCWWFWLLPAGLPALLILLVAGGAYALLLIASHEMVHGTLLGWPRLERVLGCLLGWPMAWPYNTYARLHRLHHGWNAIDPRDPERTQVLPAERQRAGPLRRWVHRHLLVWRTLVLAGIGLIADTAWKGWRLQAVDPGLTAARWLDGLGVTLVQAALLAMASAHGVLVRYLLFWLVLERVIGAIVQARGLVEHHGLWRHQSSPLLSQLYGSRTVRAGAWLNALMGGLPHHSAHHAFPAIPSSRLPLASARVAAVLVAHGQPPVPSVAGYGAALALLGADDQALTSIGSD